MTSPYTSALLNEEATAAGVPSGSTMRATVSPPIYSPQPMMPAVYPQAPAPVQYVMAPSKGGNRAETAALSLIALIVAVAACVGGYAIARQTAPTTGEMAQYQSLAAQEGFFNGRQTGFTAGRNNGIAESQQIAKLKGMIARAQAYNKGYNQGRRTGMTRPRYNPGYSNYSGCRGYNCGRGYRGYSNYGGTVQNALQSAQAYANATGSTVDVEIY